MSKVYFTQNNYTVSSITLVNRFSHDQVTKDSGLMKVRAGRDAWDLKVNCEASLITDKIGIDKVDSRTLDRRSKRK